MQLEAEMEEDVMRLSDAEYDEVEEEGAGATSSLVMTLVTLGIVRGKKRPSRKNTPCFLVRWVIVLKGICTKKR